MCKHRHSGHSRRSKASQNVSFSDALTLQPGGWFGARHHRFDPDDRD